MDIDFEQKDNKIQFLEDKKGIPDCKTVEEMISVDLSKTSSKDKCDRIMVGMNTVLSNHKYIKK